MLFTTPTEWAALGFTLIAGWFFGLASSSGGKKWKRQLEDAEVNYASARDRDEAELRTAQDRIRELERELRDSRPAPSAAPVVGAVAAGAAAPTLIERAHEASQDKGDAAPAPQPESSWIPEGPPPPPLPMGTSEASPAEPTPAPAPVQEEVAPASPAATFPAAESTAPADAGGTDSAAPGTDDQGEPAGSVSDDWLPPHVRADTAPQQ